MQPSADAPSTLPLTHLQTLHYHQLKLQLEQQHYQYRLTHDNPLTALHQSNSYVLPHLDGIRGLAVLAILFYHFSIPLFHGAFVGVDIFFILSGYLITRNILHSFYCNAFSFSQFYIRRFFRLFPAALFTILSTLVSIVLFVNPHLGKSVFISAFASLTLWSNIYFHSEAGYFDNSVKMRPLLHFWSLSVEEQFYLVWPFILAFIWIFLCVCFSNVKLFDRVAGTLLTALSICSFAFAQYAHESYPDWTFYELPCRIYQFGAGALVAFYYFPIERDSLLTVPKPSPYIARTYGTTETMSHMTNQMSGTAALITEQNSGLMDEQQQADGNETRLLRESIMMNPRRFSTSDVNDAKDFFSIVAFIVLLCSFSFLPTNPAPWLLLPLTAASVLLIAFPRSIVCQLIFCSRFLRRIGLASYSIYLAHWPVYILGKYILLGLRVPDSWNILHTLILFPLAVQLGFLLYKFIETPFRYVYKTAGVTESLEADDPRPKIKWLHVIFIVVVGIATLLFSIQGVRTDGYRGRFPEMGNLGWREASMEKKHLRFVDIGVEVTDQFNGSAEENINVKRVGDIENGVRSKYVFFGDSFTTHLQYALHNIGLKRGIYFDLHYAYHCGFRPTSELPYWTGEQEGYDCAESHPLLWSHLNQIPSDSLVVVANWWCAPYKLDAILDNLRLELFRSHGITKFAIFKEPPGISEQYNGYYACADLNSLIFSRAVHRILQKPLTGGYSCLPFEEGFEPEDQIAQERKLYSKVVRERDFGNVMFFDLFKYLCKRVGEFPDSESNYDEKYLCNAPAQISRSTLTYTVGYLDDLVHLNNVGSDYITDFVEMELFGSK